jgi:hypothetical protein
VRPWPVAISPKWNWTVGEGNVLVVQKTLNDGQEITCFGGNTIGFGPCPGFNEAPGTGLTLRYNADFDDGTKLILQPAIP